MFCLIFVDEAKSTPITAPLCQAAALSAKPRLKWQTLLLISRMFNLPENKVTNIVQNAVDPNASFWLIGNDVMP